MRKLSLVIVALCLVLSACGGQPAEEEAKIVPQEVRETIQAVVGEYEEHFAVDKIEPLDSGAMYVQLAFLFEPESQTEIKQYVLGLIDEVEVEHNYDLDLRMVAVRHIEGTDKVRMYGTGTYYTSTGKTEYKEAK